MGREVDLLPPPLEQSEIAGEAIDREFVERHPEVGGSGDQEFSVTCPTPGLFADTEAAENALENLFARGLAGNFAQRGQRGEKLERDSIVSPLA